MNINCPQCNAGYEVDTSRVPVGGIEMKCTRCHHTFLVDPHATPPSSQKTEFNLKGVTFLGVEQEGQVDKFFIQRQSGKIFGPFETRLIVQMLQTGKLTGQEQVSHDRASWVPMVSVAEFAPFASPAMPETGGSTFLGLPGVGGPPPESPTMEVPGFDRLAHSMVEGAGGGGSPWGDASGLAELPGLPVQGSPGMMGGAELPGVPAQFQQELSGVLAPSVDLPGLPGGDLPAPSPWGDSSGLAELPGLLGEPGGMLGGAELPAPAADVELPGLWGGGPELPAPGGAPLPGLPDMGADLPAPGGAPLPGLPGLGGYGAELPGLPGAELPAPGGAPLPGLPGMGAELPVPSGAPLPGLPGAELPMPGGAPLPGLYGAELPAPGGAPLPGLLGAELPTPGGAELPGLPGAELPTSGRSALPTPIGRVDLPTSGQGRLHGGAELPLAQGSGAELPRTSHGAPAAGHGRAPLPTSKEGFGNADDLFDGGQGGDAFGAFEKTSQIDRLGVAESSLFDGDEDPLEEGASLGSLPGLGVPPSLDTEESAEVASPDLDQGSEAAQSKKTKKKKKGKNSLFLTAAIGMLAVSLVIVVGLIAWQTGLLNGILGDEEVGPPVVTDGNKSKKNKPVEVVRPTKAKGALAPLRADTYKAYRGFIEGRIKKLAAKPKNTKLKSQLLLGYVLYLGHYPETEQYRKEADRIAKELQEAEGPMASLARGGHKVLTGDVEGAGKELEPLLTSSNEEVAYMAHLLLGMQALTLPEVVSAEDEEGKELVAKASPKEESPEKKEEIKTPLTDDEVMDFVTGAEEASSKKDEAGEERQDGPLAEPPAVVEEAPAYTSLMDRSVGYLHKAADLDKEAPAPLFFLGALWQKAGDFKKANKNYKKAQERAKTHIPSILGQAQLAYLSGRLGDMDAHVDLLLGDLSSKASKMERSQALLLKGLQLSARRKSKDAIESMIESLKVDPTNAEALAALGAEFFRNNKYKEALKYFTTNNKLSQKDPEVMLGIVKSYTGLDKLKEASAKLEAGSRAFPTDARFPFYLGLIREKEGNWKDAQKRYRSAMQIDPSFTRAYVRLALLLIGDNEKAKAEDLLKQAIKQGAERDPQVAVDVGAAYLLLGKDKRALKALERALKLNASNLDARVHLARHHLKTGKPDRALGLLKPFMDGDIEDANMSFLLADIYRVKEEYEKSIEYLDRLIELEPKNATYVHQRGLVYFDWKNLDTARAQFLKAYSMDPNFSEAYFYAGRVDFEQGKFKQAMKAFRSVLDEKRNNGDYRYYMGFALERSGNLTQALEEYKAIERFVPDYGDKNPEMFYRRGRIMTLLGNYRQAKQDLVKVLQKDPTHFGALVALGDTFFDERKYKQAVDLYGRALKLNDEVSYVHYQSGLAYRFLKKRNEALRALEKAVSLGHKEPRVHKILAFDYRDSGQSGRAIASFKAYLAMRPKAEDRKEIEAQVKRLGGRL